MNTTTYRNFSETRHLTYSHTFDYAEMHFNHKLWSYFPYKQIESRLLSWADAAQGDLFRQPTSWKLTDGDLIVQLPALPDGFVPFSQLHHEQLSDETKAKLLIPLCKALSILHNKQFYMGFLSPDMLFFHPKTLAILVDVQPFPSAIEFINHLLTDYPYSLFPRYARRFLLSRVADFESIHLLLESMYNGLVPAALQPLSERLYAKPESFLFVDEIAASLLDYLHLPAEPQPATDIQNSSKLLHPAASPITHDQQERFRDFLKSNEYRLLGLICEDEAIRFDLYAQHINEVIEKGYYFKIISQELPYSTLREVVSRTLHRAYDILPESITMLRNLARKFDQLLKKHYEGDDILYLLTEWLHQFFMSVIPLFPIQNFVFTFENCEHFDEDSQLILLNFWREHGHEMNCLNFIFSGSRIPAHFTEVPFQVLNMHHADPAIYEQLLASQFGRADEALIDQLKNWLYEYRINASHCRIILEELAQSHSIQITRNGWKPTTRFHLDYEQLNPLRLIAKRIAVLDVKDLELMRLLCCLPMPVHAASLFTANRLDAGNILLSVTRLAELGLMHVSRNDSLFISNEIIGLVLQQLPEDKLASYYQTALKYLYRYRPFALPQLITLSCQAGEYKVEYYLLIKYYRQIRTLLSYSQKAEILERIKYLYEKLERPYLVFLDRLLSRMYHLLNQFALSEQLALTVYERTGTISDRFSWLSIRIIQNNVDVYQLREELFPFIFDEKQLLTDRVRAAFLLNTSNLCFPLQDEEMHTLHKFYIEVAYPKRHSLALRHFAEITNYYTINMLIHFPEMEEWALSIAAKLEPLLDSSPHTDLMLRLYDVYSYQSNNKIINTYVYRGIEGAKRSGYTIKEQVGHLNAMELSLNQGDIASYLYHKERVLQVDKLRRKDLAENYLTNQLLFALEWEEWALFHQLETSLIEQQITDWGQSLLAVYQGYAAFRQQLPVHVPDFLENENHSVFLEALHQTGLGNTLCACQLFEQFIAKNNAGLYAGWAYREMITLLLKLHSEREQVDHWFDKFETYLKQYAYDVFWPDYYRLSAERSMVEGDIQPAMLYLRRALNGYQMIQKETWRPYLTACMEQAIAPSYAPASPAILQDDYVQKMMADREQWLLLSLDLQIIIELSEQITETLDLSTTMQRLTKALFDYFPVIQLSITYKLLHYKQKVFVTASGLRDHDELVAYQTRSEDHCVLVFTLFQRGDQAITLQVHVDGMTKTKQQHMEHFLSFIKPHIINVLLHREMVIDNLTGFYLRGYFMEKLREEFELASRYQLDLSVIMIDVDNFRRVNEFGHPEGDRVLREIADIFRFNLRKSDIAGRYGGEELILILPKTDGKEALKIAHQLRGEIEKEFAYGRPYTITVSVGVSSLELCQPSSIEQLIEQADTAEITAKRTGKNKVIAAWEL
ncbi:GGDEF domain-containing protein [Paenibacillus sp. CGMCC 1.16610]|uniref:Diguanylate cyclase n=1 Tax=Paenibacillus anseongense TaxID=2682845 RepID=A0ABW9U3X1_9BACL|nr:MULTISPECIES: GGDEF domain-containing protein [Paenibacillus]MBA2943243.1 GGDEF domain-containing protein [Paenibacillus sp. CGMCC 1.16610]MVQ33741.1 diguanylate cyclase [Paenibacillus anseongense]